MRHKGTLTPATWWRRGIHKSESYPTTPSFAFAREQLSYQTNSRACQHSTRTPPNTHKHTMWPSPQGPSFLPSFRHRSKLLSL